VRPNRPGGAVGTVAVSCWERLTAAIPGVGLASDNNGPVAHAAVRAHGGRPATRPRSGTGAPLPGLDHGAVSLLFAPCPDQIAGAAAPVAPATSA